MAGGNNKRTAKAAALSTETSAAGTRKEEETKVRADSDALTTDEGDGGEYVTVDDVDPHNLIWSPSQVTSIVFLFLVRVLAARTTCVADCDETYNYWEPLHYMLYGFGQQTWEYAPQYALRSYAYLIPSLSAAKLSQVVIGLFSNAADKTQVWLGVKIFWAVLCGVSELAFFRAVTYRFGKKVGGMTLLFSGMSAGMFTACSALLPSSTAMILVMFVYTAWLRRRWTQAILLGVVCVFGLAWPFTAVLFIPMAFDCLYQRYFKEGGGLAMLKTCVWGILCAAGILSIVTYVDSSCYNRWTSPNFNIFRYNVLDAAKGRGDELYGVENWTYYGKNLILNTNIAILLALLLPAIGLVVQPVASKAFKSTLRTRMTFASPLFIWLFIMVSKPHKEERFLYPVYPLIFLAAALTLQTFLDLSESVHTDTHYHDSNKKTGTTTTSNDKKEDKDSDDQTALTTTGGGGGGGGASLSFNPVPQMLCMAVVSCAAFFGMLRTSAVVRFYGAPCHTYKAAYYQEFADYWTDPYTRERQDDDVRLCVGGEWHRFPSSFFIPSDKIKLSYVRSTFHGQLPQPYVGGGRGMSAEPLQPFNDLNKEEEARYTRLRDCDYVIELTLYDKDNLRTSDLMHELARTRGRWEHVVGFKFLDVERSDPALRAFFVPWLSEMAVRYGQMGLYRRVKPDPEGETPSRNV